MNITEIKVQDIVLVQPDPDTRERAKIVGIDYQTGKVIVKLSNTKIVAMEPQYVLKSFGPL